MKLGGFFNFREKDDPKPFLDHIEDLRWMLLKMIITLVLTMSGSFVFQTTIVRVIMGPYRKIDPEMKGLMNIGVADPFIIAMTLSFYVGLILAFPVLIFFLAEFILPALTPKEKRMLYPASAAGFGVFLAGAAFAYFVVLPPSLKYFFNYSKDFGWQPTWTVREYISFTTQFIIAFGLCFELPLGVLLLVRLGVLSYETLQKTRRFAIVIILFLAAIIMPTTDIFTWLIIAAPMYLLYEGCIGIAWVMDRRDKKQAKAGEPKFTIE